VTEDIGELIGAILFLVIFVPILATVALTAIDQIRGDYIEESKHEEVVDSLESDILALETSNSELKSDKEYLDRVVANYSDNRSDLRQERNYYENLSTNLSEENRVLEEDNVQLEEEIDRTITVQRVFDHTVQVWNVETRVVYVFSLSIVFVFSLTFTLVEVNLIGLKEGKISLQEIYQKVKTTVVKISEAINKGRKTISDKTGLLNSNQ